MRHALQIISLLCLFYTGSCITTLKVLPVTVVTQGNNPWCWAAVSAMAIEHITGTKLDACKVAEIHSGTKPCCISPSSCQYGLSSTEMYVFLKEKLKLQVSAQWEKPSFQDIQESIWNNKLLIYGIATSIDYEQLGTIEGHVFIINGYCRTNQTIFIIDPASGAKTIPYALLDNLGQFLWMYSIGE